MAGASEAFFGAGGFFKLGYDFDSAGEDGDGDHLGDFLAGADFDGRVAQVGHEDEDFAAVAGIDDSGGGGETFGRHGRAVADEQAEGGTGGGMAGLDGYAGADFDGGAGNEEGRFEGEEVIAEVFAGVSDYGDAGGGVEEFYAEHGAMVTERG